MKICRLSLFIVMVTCSVAGTEEIASFVEPYKDIDVASPEMGTVASVRAKEGDQVIAGQVVATLDEEVLHAALQVAKTAMEARGRLRSAQAELRLQNSRLKKLIGLRERQHASDEEVMRAEAQREIAEAQVQAVHDELKVKLAEHARIRIQLEQKRIKSPIAGTVTEVYKDAGEFVSASEPVILKIVQLDPLLGIFSVPAVTARTLQTDQEVPLTIGPRRERAHGVVEFVSPTADAQSGTTRVRVRIPNTNNAFHSGDACWLQLQSSPSHGDATRPDSSTARIAE